MGDGGDEGGRRDGQWVTGGGGMREEGGMDSGRRDEGGRSGCEAKGGREWVGVKQREGGSGCEAKGGREWV